MSPRHLRTFTTGAVASVALAVTGTSVLSANQAGRTGTLESSASRETSTSTAPAAVAPDVSGITAQRGQAVGTKVKDVALRTATLTDIPPEALAAYQRAADSIKGASPECGLPWTVLAGIGQVESDHGRTSSRNAKGIVGVPLDGKGVKAVADTDGGALDGDAKFDRAVGPMQILPSTWAVVAVDGDGDGKRDPQDLDDAALGAAVYLCGSGEDLATAAGQRAALRTYNNSASYVSLVMSVAAAYAKDQSATYSVASMPSGSIDFRSVGTTYAGSHDDGAVTGSPQAGRSGKATGRTTSGTGPSTSAGKTPPSTTGPTKNPTTGGTTTPGAPAPTTPKPGDGSTTTPAPAPVWKRQVPSVVTMQVEAALTRLKSSGFVGTRTDVYDPAAEGTVLAQSLTGSARTGSTVGLTVSLGPVADVVGSTYADAVVALQAQGLDVVTTGADPADLATVTAQTPDHLAKGETVTLTLAAPAPAPAG